MTELLLSLLLTATPADSTKTVEVALADAKRPALVDLSGEEIPSLAPGATSGIAATEPWYDKLDITGFGAAGYLRSGPGGERPNGGFAVKETSLFLEADVWENTSLFFEIQVSPLLQDDRVSFETGEVYANFRNVWTNDSGDHLGFKVGRIDIPFGEEYVWGDSPDNPMISHTVSFPWLTDEGVAAYGRFRGVGWVASITDGTMMRSVDETASKAFNLKVYGQPWRPVSVSASVMRNDDTSMSALYLGETCFSPVGDDIHGRPVPSTAGQSPSDFVDVVLSQVDVTVSPINEVTVWTSAGRAFVDDTVESFDRNLRWFSAEMRAALPIDRTYAAVRYSEMGTTRSDGGYSLGGGFLTDGRLAFGYDVTRVQRWSAGLGWRVNPRAVAKVEVGADRFELIDASPLELNNDDFGFSAVEIVVSF